VRHRRAHLTRAVLEGVAFGLRDCFDLVRQAGPNDVREVRISGGGARGALWAGILASVLETDLVRVLASEGAASGAALLAGVGAGNWPDVPSACAGIARAGAFHPRSEDSAVYRQLQPEYRAIYEALTPTFARLSG
ncbi:MAG: FGGY-family carbohydrate kinase, partial [Ktedonobacterales bacterium]